MGTRSQQSFALSRDKKLINFCNLFFFFFSPILKEPLRNGTGDECSWVKTTWATLQIYPRIYFQGEDLFGRHLDHQPSQKPSLQWSSGLLGCIKRAVSLLLSKLSIMLTVNHIILHVETIIYKHVSDESSWYLQKWMYKVMNISLQAKWQARSRNEAGIQELPVPMPFIQIVSYKDEVWEQ